MNEMLDTVYVQAHFRNGFSVVGKGLNRLWVKKKKKKNGVWSLHS